MKFYQGFVQSTAQAFSPEVLQIPAVSLLWDKQNLSFYQNKCLRYLA